MRTDLSLLRTLLALLGAAWLSACASSGAVPQPFPVPGGSTAAAPAEPRRGPEDSAPATPGEDSTAVADGYALTSTALALRGTPYRDGGTSPKGFDCSGFVQYVFGRHGVRLPRLTRDQFRVGHRVDPDQLEPGDLVFFTTVAPGASHVGIAVGPDQFVHAPSERGVVRVERLSSSYWSRRFIGARRLP